MRQTFQQWMVLLSALVLLLLPALLCHAAPMDTGASSSSGAHYPAIDAEPNVPGDSSGIKDFHHYYTSFRIDPNMPTLTNDELEEHFGTRIHYKGTPVLFTDADPDTKVQHALKHYGKVWLVGPPPTSPRLAEPMYLHLQKIMQNDREILDSRTPDWKSVHQQVRDARKFAAQYGEEAQHLRYGRPFAERKGSKLFGYNVPKWKDIEKLSTPAYNLKTTRFHLRKTLDKYNYLKIDDTNKNRFLGFALDKNGEVLFEEFGLYRP
ncbi:uncharacterized protein UDID_19324 [Ustilago sp. UG-2017a]|nr:uncharacterized protein UDID_19324 [Ustilago sp. UG-2017a]